ncbi:S-adenosyl-L-methionine-dependent methyltransferase [Myriangium duriaei CBS 260.36]|uniref:S-adenosyl-L-methionine-dependent methyltransferase n=1 Tax=Myriangium duriaei CBS 260.36 TaxID=1168546 RepID=A0A9P4MK61_9PEZI|nr:S-adenosyl-L-methionine-dependent methyltransferase [Myriangium duriaei CBS 260.36]
MEKILENLRVLRYEVEQLKQADPAATSRQDQERQARLYREARALLLSVETPPQSIVRICFQIWESISITTANNMGIFDVLNSGPGPHGDTEIAQACHADLLLVQRILRCLTAYGVVNKVSAQRQYSATMITRTFAAKEGRAAVRFLFEFLAPAWSLFPRMVEEKGWQALKSSTDTVLNRAYHAPIGKTVWEILPDTPFMEDAGVLMASFNQDHQDWLDFYPIQNRLIHGTKSDPAEVFMVDVGGATGSQAIACKARFPNIPGRFIVQDLAHALPRGASTPTGIEIMVHDFFHNQPVQGARLYYLRYISYDWADDKLLEILNKLKIAMVPGYSKIVIHDWIMPEDNASTFMTSQDLNMMSSGGGEERTEARHKQYITAAGLQVSGIWDIEDGISEAVIECQLPI